MWIKSTNKLARETKFKFIKNTWTKNKFKNQTQKYRRQSNILTFKKTINHSPFSSINENKLSKINLKVDNQRIQLLFYSSVIYMKGDGQVPPKIMIG